MSLIPGSDILCAFPALADLDGPASDALRQARRTLALDAGTPVFEAGQECRQYLLIQAGSVRMHLLDSDGHEIVLYRLGRGETYILTTAALFGRTSYTAYAVTEAPTTATGIASRAFESLVARSAGFRRFVFAAHAGRIADLMQVVSDVAFTRIQVRLARCLLRRADALGRVAMTHEAIATGIGTAREVVSRNLKSLVRQGCLRLGQGTMTILDAGLLTSLAEDGSRWASPGEAGCCRPE